MKKVLVTGGAGFLGSHLCKRLLAEGSKVTCIDNYFTGNKNNILGLIKNKNFKYLNHDIVVPFYDDFDEIYNLACPASPVHYQHNPLKTLKTSVVGSINLLEMAVKSNAKILQASTSEVYGDPKIHPQHENYWGNVNPVGIRSCYDEGKRCAETLFMDYHNTYNINVKIIRIFNTYGPNMNPDDGRVVSNFIVQALKGKDLTIHGDGRQTRSFQYVDDLIEGILRMMNSDDNFLGPVNLGNPNEFTIIELANTIIKITNSKSKLVFCDLPKDDPKQRRPDISLAYKKLNGWRPKTELFEGLEHTINYFKKII